MFVSPGEPTFWAHHAMVDRVWWIWQQMDPEHRTMVVSGTRTMGNAPPSPDATLEDMIDLGVNGGPVALKTLTSTTAGPFNYIYE